MATLPLSLVCIVLAIHVYIAIFEMFLWERRGPKVFAGFDRDLFGRTKALAFNQGVYNGFLAAGLAWALVIGDPVWQRAVATCFLSMVAVAGVAGALTAERKILFVQTVPAAGALGALWLT